jgi:hypothetical protein
MAAITMAKVNNATTLYNHAMAEHSYYLIAPLVPLSCTTNRDFTRELTSCHCDAEGV